MILYVSAVVRILNTMSRKSRKIIHISKIMLRRVVLDELENKCADLGISKQLMIGCMIETVLDNWDELEIDLL